MILFCFTKNSGKDMLLHVLTGGLFLHDSKEFTLLLPVFRESVQYFGQRYAFGNCAPCPQSVKVEDRQAIQKRSAGSAVFRGISRWQRRRSSQDYLKYVCLFLLRILLIVVRYFCACVLSFFAFFRKTDLQTAVNFL